MSVLVVAAHPDDEVLGPGATLARLAAEGHDVHVLILAEGHTSRFAQRDEGDATELAALVGASDEAARRLGTRTPVHGGLPDNRLDGVDLLDVVKLVEAQVELAQPELVLTHHPGDLNVDHRIAAQATLAATRPQPSCPVREVLAFEVPSATEWAFGATGPAFAPTAFYDVAATFERKLDALAAYEAELRPAPHARSIEAITALATWRGATVGVAAAEAFEVLRSTR